MNLAILKGIPQNVILLIFSAGLFAGILVTLVLFGLSGREPSSASSRGKEESPSEIIRAIKKRAAGEEGGVGIGGLIGFLFFIFMIGCFCFAMVVIYKFIKEGQPAGETFIPYFLRVFFIPLSERYPILKGLFGGA